MIDVIIKDGYANDKGLTVEEMAKLCLELTKKGLGDYELLFGFDGNCRYTSTDGEYIIIDDEEIVAFEEQDY